MAKKEKACCCHEHLFEKDKHSAECRCGEHSHTEGIYHTECGCEHHENNTFKVILFSVAAAVFISALLIDGIFSTILFLLAYILLGYEIIKYAFLNILKGKVFDENFLMTIATIGAIIIGEYPEAVGVMLFYRIGEMLEDYAIKKSEKSINAILDIKSDYAYIEIDGKREQILSKDVKVGDTIVVAPGEKIALDGIVIRGESWIDTSSITGESVMRKADEGKEVLSGSVNGDGVLYIKVTKEFENSTASKIISIMRESLEKKAKTEKYISVFAKKYTPIVVGLAVLLAVVPPIFDNLDFAKWVYRALIFLVISCPCALVISVPMGFFAGLGGASKYGIIIKGGSSLEALSKADTVVFDKTGTLTEGVFEITDINSNVEKQEFLKFLAYAENYSNHPIAKACKLAYKSEILENEIRDYKEIAGLGICAKIFDKKVFAGNSSLMKQIGIDIKPLNDSALTKVYMAVDNEYWGEVSVSDRIRKTNVINDLKKLGIKSIMLSGDLRKNAEAVSEKLGIDEVYAELMPEDKVRIFKEKSQNHNCVFVGDGINDAPVLALSSAGIAMGGIGSDAAVEASDIILTDDDISKIPKAIKISKNAMKIIKQNIVFSISVKVLIMILGVLGISNMWFAVFADVGVAFLAILNALRA